MKTALILTLALFATLTVAKSVSEKELLEKLTDVLLKRQPGPFGGGPGPFGGGRPPKPNCGNEDFLDVVKECVGSEIPFDDLADIARPRFGRGPPRLPLICALKARLGDDAATVATCVKAKCTFPEGMDPENIPCPEPCEGGASLKDVVQECVAPYGTLPFAEKRHMRPPFFCIVAEVVGQENLEAVKTCVTAKCPLPEDFQAPDLSKCPTEPPCVMKNLKSCSEAAGISKPDGPPRLPRVGIDDMFCLGVETFGAEKAEQVSQCLSDACGVPLRSASECTAPSKRHLPGSCTLSDVQSCAQQVGIPGPPQQRRGLGRPDRFCRAVERFGAAMAEDMNACLVAQCGAEVKAASDCESNVKKALKDLLGL
jgi:hypothetical protein